MTSPTTAIRVDAEEALTTLGLILGRAEDLTPVLAGPVNESVNRYFVQQFDSEGGHGGLRWAKLSPVTLKLRQRRGRGRGGILRDTNRLWASLTKLGLGPDAIRIITPRSLERGTSVPYARSHQTGWRGQIFGRGSVTVPARVIIPDPMPRRISQEWVDLIGAYVGRGKT